MGQSTRLSASEPPRAVTTRVGELDEDTWPLQSRTLYEILQLLSTDTLSARKIYIERYKPVNTLKGLLGARSSIDASALA